MIKKIFLNLISFFSHIIPRNNHLWVTGKIASWEYDNTPPAFFDNSKYFFLYLINHTDERVYWISSSQKEIDMLKSMNLPVIKFHSIKGVWLVLRAKFSFHHYGSDQIDHILQRGSIQLNFWHGTPLKKIQYDVIDKPSERHNIYLDIMQKSGIEYIFSTSKYLSEKILAKAFDAEQEKFLNFGYPRMDVMGLSRDENFEFCKKYSPELLPYIELAKEYNKVFLYMPTYRDDDPDYFEKADIDFDKMSKKLKKIRGVFFFKLHPLTSYTTVKKCDNIIQISNDVDIYPFLTYTDFLITDYSSVFFDYLLFDKEIIFIPYDLKRYLMRRELYFDYNEITPGVKYKNFATFIEKIEDIDELDYRLERKRVSDLIIDNYHFDACEKTYRFIQKQYQ